MVTRSRKASVKPTIAHPVEDAVIHGEQPQAKPTAAERYQAMLDAARAYAAHEDDNGISWQRKFMAYLVAALSGMGLGFLAAPVIEFFTLGALALTGSATICLIVYLLGLVLIFVAGYRLGGIVGTWVITGKADEHFASASNKVRGFFTRSPKEVAA